LRAHAFGRETLLAFSGPWLKVRPGEVVCRNTLRELHLVDFLACRHTPRMWAHIAATFSALETLVVVFRTAPIDGGGGGDGRWMQDNVYVDADAADLMLSRDMSCLAPLKRLTTLHLDARRVPRAQRSEFATVDPRLDAIASLTFLVLSADYPWATCALPERLEWLAILDTNDDGELDGVGGQRSSPTGGGDSVIAELPGTFVVGPHLRQVCVFGANGAAVSIYVAPARTTDDDTNSDGHDDYSGDGGQRSSPTGGDGGTLE
jgi:hypothetical protein